MAVVRWDLSFMQQDLFNPDNPFSHSEFEKGSIRGRERAARAPAGA
jgi:hypothetical protein